MALEGFRNRFINVENTVELHSTVKELLPLKDSEFKVRHVRGSTKFFTASIDCNFVSEDEFIDNYTHKTDETLRRLTPKFPGKKSEFKKLVYFRCHHNTRYQPTMNSKDVLTSKPSKRFKNTDCPFSLVLKYKKDNSDGYNCLLSIEWTHNHPVKSLQSLSFKDIHKDTASEIRELFEKGYTPGLAYREFTRRIKSFAANDLEFHKEICDRSVFPRRTDYNYLFTEFNRLKYGTQNTDAMFKRLQELADQKTQESSESLINYQKFDADEGDAFILIIITPLMKRVHEKVRSAGELVFIDSSGGMEEYNLRVFMIVTHSYVGALPLGIIITSDETTDTLTKALELFADSLPDYAFFHKGKNGPNVIMTDNCDELKDALHAVWPKASLLLCIFHIMQQVWRWLFDKKHGIQQNDRTVIMLKFKRVVYAEEKVETEEAFSDLIESINTQYPNLCRYFDGLFEMREKWCISDRKHLIIRGNNTNNYVESQFLVIKDNILNRTKEVNVNGLLEKLTEELNDHYKVKLLGVANGRFDGIYSSRFMGKSKTNKEGIGFKLPSDSVLSGLVDNITDNGNKMYTVPSFTGEVSYNVDMDLGICECSVGKDGSPCKHQYLIWKNVLKSTSFLPYLCGDDRKLCSYIAIGEVLPDSLYEGLHDYVTQDQELRANSAISERNGNENGESLPTDNGVEEIDNPTDIRRSVEFVTAEECKLEFAKTAEVIDNLIGKNKDNQSFLKGIMKFCERVAKQQSQTSKITSAFHCFGGSNNSHNSKKVTRSSVVKKKLGKKIKVQPEAVKRRKIENGSKTSVTKGVRKRKNPFENQQASVKRLHSFSLNVKNNEPASKKAGRTMASKTRTSSKACVVTKTE